MIHCLTVPLDSLMWWHPGLNIASYADCIIYEWCVTWNQVWLVSIADGSWGCHWLALSLSGRGVRWKGWGVFTHRLSITAADAASEINCSAQNLTWSIEWTSRRGSVAFSRVGLRPAGLRSPPVSPLCVWPSSPQRAARWNSLSPGGRLWRDWGHAFLGDWDCRQTE